jgi:hypothetical protein
MRRSTRSSPRESNAALPLDESPIGMPRAVRLMSLGGQFSACWSVCARSQGAGGRRPLRNLRPDARPRSRISIRPRIYPWPCKPAAQGRVAQPVEFALAYRILRGPIEGLLEYEQAGHVGDALCGAPVVIAAEGVGCPVQGKSWHDQFA